MFLWLIFATCLIILFIYLHKKPVKTIAFIGPRSSGKTRTLYKICYGIDPKTVPTLLEYSVNYKKFVLKEIPPQNNQNYSDLLDSVRYFYFINSLEDIKSTKNTGSNISYVYFKDKESLGTTNQDVFCLDNEPLNLIKLFK